MPNLQTSLPTNLLSFLKKRSRQWLIFKLEEAFNLHKMGDPPPCLKKEYGERKGWGRINIKLPDDTYANLRKWADYHDMQVSDLFRGLLNDWYEFIELDCSVREAVKVLEVAA